MADITWLGDSYTNVPYVQLPQTGGGNASFYEESGTLTISQSGTQSVHTYANVSVPSGTAGTPTATKGTVSNHSVTVTPSVTNTTGFITGSTKSGTAVTVSASELVSGNKEITSNGTDIDVANFSTVSVSVSGTDFIVTLTWNSQTEIWTPDKTFAEIVDAETQGLTTCVCADDGSYAYCLYDSEVPMFCYGVATWDNDANAMRYNEYEYSGNGIDPIEPFYMIVPAFDTPSKTYTPTESQQTDTISYDPNDGFNGIEEVEVTVNAIPSNYVGSSIPRRDWTDITFDLGDGSVEVPAGYYASAAGRAMPTGAVNNPTATKGSVSNHAISVTPSVSFSAGCIATGTKSGTAVTVSASELVSGNKEITSNGTDIDVTNYATVSVNVSGGGGSAVVVTDETLPGGGTAKHITAVDLSGDTVDAAHLATGYTAHDSSGNAVLGTMSGGGGGAEAADVNFIDYDGTIVQSYTASDFAALTALPSNPSHTGLTAQGWNWSLSDAKTYVASYGKLNIGQMYVTSSGDTEIDIELTDGRTSPYLGISVNGTVTVDWGDNSATSTVTGTSLSTQKRTLHEYAAAGEYTISIRLSSGSYALYGSSTYGVLSKSASTSAQNRIYGRAVKRVRIGGSGTTKIGAYAFNNCYGLESITIPSTITSIDTNTFSNCFALKSLTIPSNVTSLPQPTANQSYNLTSLALPKGLTSIGDSAFSGCSNLKSVTLPSTVTSVGASSFATCSALETLIIPSGVTSVGNNAFKESYKLKNVTVPSTITSRGTYLFTSCRLLESVTNNAAGISDYEYNYCYNLTSVNILSGTTSIGGYAFGNCYNLTSLTIPSTVTSIGDYAFSTCYSLAKITIPSAVTSIGSSAFASCTGLKEIHFQPSTPPTAGASAFNNLPPDCVIYVPTGTLTTYTGMANYPSSSTYTYVEE